MLVKCVLACSGSHEQMIRNKPKFSLSACHLWLSEFPIRWVNYVKISLVRTGRQADCWHYARHSLETREFGCYLYPQWLTQLHWGVGGVRWDGYVNQGYLLHRTNHGVLPSRVRLSFVSVGVALPGDGVPVWAGVPAGAGLPWGFYFSPRCFIVVPPPTAGGGRWGYVLPECCPVVLSGAGWRGVVPWVLGLCARLGERNAAGVAGNRRVVVAARVGGWFSYSWSGVCGIIIWIPPEK